MEPFLSLGVRKALFCPSAGVVSPYEYTFSLAENAIQNGVEVLVGKREGGREKRGEGTVFFVCLFVCFVCLRFSNIHISI